MRWFDRVKAKWRWFGIPNLMAYVTSTMLVLYVAENILGLNITAHLSFVSYYIFQGQIWRLLTFLVLPEARSPFWFLLSLFIYYSIGTSLENKWGTGTFTLYYLLGGVGAIVSGLITGWSTNLFLNTSLIMAFGFLFPDAQFRLYFVLPVKAFYIAIAEVIIYAISFVQFLFTGNWSMACALLFSLLNVLIFFGPDFLDESRRRMASRKRRKEFERQMRGGK